MKNQFLKNICRLGSRTPKAFHKKHIDAHRLKRNTSVLAVCMQHKTLSYL